MYQVSLCTHTTEFHLYRSHWLTQVSLIIITSHSLPAEQRHSCSGPPDPHRAEKMLRLRVRAVTVLKLFPRDNNWVTPSNKCISLVSHEVSEEKINYNFTNESDVDQLCYYCGQRMVQSELQWLLRWSIASQLSSVQLSLSHESYLLLLIFCKNETDLKIPAPANQFHLIH